MAGPSAPRSRLRLRFRWWSEPDHAPTPTPAHAAATEASDPSDGLGPWRATLVPRVVWISLAAGAVPAGLVLRDAVQTGDWRNALLCWLAMGLVALVHLPGRIPRRLTAGLTAPQRAQVSVGLLFALGAWLLAHGSAGALLFLLACPVMGVLAVGTRWALAVLGLGAVALVGIGWARQVPLPLTSGPAGDHLGRWLVFAGLLLMLGLLLVLSCHHVLRRLAEAMQRHREAADSLRRSEQVLREVAAQVPGMVYRVRFGPGVVTHFAYVSPGSVPLLGLQPEVLMADPRLLVAHLHPDDLQALQDGLDRAFMQPGPQQMELRLARPGAAVQWLALSSTEVARDAVSVVHNGIMTDVTSRKQAEVQLWRQSRFDALTGLPNRLMLHETLADAVAHTVRGGPPLALLLIDLDHFKEVNDTLGHALGDRLLALAADRLRACVPAGATVARMGGDEFTVLLPGLDAPEAAERLAQRIVQVLAEPFHLDHERAHLSASLGVAVCPHDAGAMDDLLKHADQAMYSAKAAGRNRLARFTPDLQAQARRRMRLGNDLRDALAGGQLHLLYQPIVDLRTGAVSKAEALLRWDHPQFGSIEPALFIPLAEASGLIGEIGDWVFRSAAQQALDWRQRLHPQFQITVNRSPAQFQAELRPRAPWPEVLAGLGLPGDAIGVEITEGLLLDSTDAVARQLQALRDAGMAVSMDDFGTGYSALAYLHRFAIDVLKIDRSFVSGISGIGAGDTGRSLCRAMVLLAHELGMRVVAEGVETAEQARWLREAGCDLGQGFFFGHPMAATAFADWMAGRVAAAEDQACSASSFSTSVCSAAKSGAPT